MLAYYKIVCGLKSKLSFVHVNISSLLHFDYFILTETWLTLDINDTELNLFDYNIYKLDCHFNNSCHNRDGGILIALHTRFRSSILTPINLKCELSVMVYINNVKVYYTRVTFHLLVPRKFLKPIVIFLKSCTLIILIFYLYFRVI